MFLLHALIIVTRHYDCTYLVIPHRCRHLWIHRLHNTAVSFICYLIFGTNSSEYVIDRRFDLRFDAR